MGQGGQVIEDTGGTGRYAKCRTPKRCLGVLRDRGRRHLPCRELYRQLFNPQLYLLAYGRIYANKGAIVIFRSGLHKRPRGGAGLHACSDAGCQKSSANSMHLTKTRVHNLAASYGR
jgi:hypothetical protein